MDLTDYRNSATERARIGDLMNLLPKCGGTVLDIGARDGYISKLLADSFSQVVALDLERPSIDHPRVTCVAGDITALQLEDESFELVFCAEVLEHIPPQMLATACRELARVSKKYVLVGVPFKQDIRVGRTTCKSCGGISPPWGHVNMFTEDSLAKLFPGLAVTRKSFVGETNERTNAFSSLLMDLAGNPYGTYSQEEPCVHCGATLQPPPDRQFWQKLLTKASFVTMGVQKRLTASHPNWIHILMRK